MLNKPNLWVEKIFAGIFLMTLIAPVSAFADDTVVIVNKSNEVNSLSLTELQALFKGSKKEWGDGEAVVIFIPPSNSEALMTLAKKVFKENVVSGISRYYLKAIFQQKLTTPPETLDSPDEATTSIAEEPGGITIIEADKAGPEVKIIIVDGL